MYRHALTFLTFLALLRGAHTQEAISRTNRSLLQPEMQAQLQAGGMNKDDYLTGDWGGYRQDLHRAGI